MDFDSEELITYIRERPLIWNKQDPRHGDKEARDQQWNEVCRLVVNEDWGNINDLKKDSLRREIQKKWKNIRDCFRKDLNRQKELQQSGLLVDKRRKRRYMFYDQLNFLIPTIADDLPDTSHPESVSGDFDMNGEGHQLFLTDGESLDHNPVETEALKNSGDMNYSSVYGRNYQLMRIDHENNEEVDGDKLFLLSLLPTFKKLSPEQSFELKIEFLKAAQKMIASCKK